MTTPAPPTATLAAWLEQQLAADEALAMAATAGPWVRDVGVLISNPGPTAKYVADCYDEPGGSVADAAHIAANDPAQTLRRVAAMRQVLARCAAIEAGMPSYYLAQGVIRLLASQYADRDGYRAEEWA